MAPAVHVLGCLSRPDTGTSSHTDIVGLSLDMPVIVGATNATELLRSGLTVTVEAATGIVYSGAASGK